MSQFLSRLNMELMVDAHWEPLLNRDGRQLYQLLSPFIYQSDVAKMTITVPTGFVTDLASVPRWPLIYDAFGDTAQMPAVIHDYLYSAKSAGLVSRATADEVLNEAMALTDVPAWRRWAMWAGVRIGGAAHFGT